MTEAAVAFTKTPTHMDLSEGRWRIHCRDGSCVRYARAVMEAHLGRVLSTDEHVHHINGDKQDDRLENLTILSPAAHMRLHLPELTAARRAKWRFAWSRDFPACVGCGTTDRPHYGKGRCQRCYHRIYMRQRRAAA